MQTGKCQRTALAILTRPSSAELININKYKMKKKKDKENE